MNPERWERIKQLLGSALEQEPSQRDTFLRDACGGDDVLRAELVTLLAAYDSEQSLPPKPLPRAAGAADLAGTRIGPYRLIRQIGMGGMGAVFLAARADDTFHKSVAIKLVQAGVNTDEILQRFRHERQILATFDHPNIAKLLDGGTTDDRLPYFVMDYVEGTRIDEYCESHKLKVDERIALFLGVCSAVQYVHQNLVVHRDLKPGNILVTPEGVPKLLDFGIAKLLKPEMFTSLVDATRVEFRLMTPGYASPEQVRGEPVTTASDVYSLGVILYELLTSRRPYRVKTDSPAEILRAVCDQEPERPSTAVTRPEDAGQARRTMTPESIAAGRGTLPDKLRKQLAGDLDTIVAKALRKEPQRRYASVDQFAEDLRRHLQGLPVSAHRDSWSYRSRKFIRRHRVGVAAAVLIAGSLVGGVLTTSWQARVARIERANAQQQFNDLRKLANSFLFEFHDAIENLPGSTPARKLVVQRALEYLAKLNGRARGNPGLQRELAEAYLRVGDVQGNPYLGNLGDTEGALESYQQALQISQSLTAADARDRESSRLLARGYESLGEVLPVLGRPTDALANLRKASDLFEALTAADPGNQKLAADLAGCYQALGDLQGHSGLQNLGDPAAAFASYRKALAIYRAQISSHQNIEGARRGLAVLEIRIGDLEISRGEEKQGLSDYRDALGLLEELSAGDRSNVRVSTLLALGYQKVGGAQEETNPAEALRSYARAADAGERLLKADPNNARAAMSLAIALRYTGDLQARRADRAGALANYQRVLQILERLALAEPRNVLLQGRYAETLAFVSDLLARTGKPDEARRMTSRSLAINRELATREEATPDDLYQYAETFLTCTPADLREPATALAYLKRAAAKSRGNDVDTLDLLAEAYFENGEPRQAIETEQKALSLVPPANPRRQKLELRLAKFQAKRKPPAP